MKLGTHMYCHKTKCHANIPIPTVKGHFVRICILVRQSWYSEGQGQTSHLGLYGE